MSQSYLDERYQSIGKIPGVLRIGSSLGYKALTLPPYAGCQRVWPYAGAYHQIAHIPVAVQLFRARKPCVRGTIARPSGR